VKRHTTTTAIPSFTAGADAFLIFAPIPGVAFLYGSVATNVLTLTPATYSDSAALFPPSGPASVVNAFRYASNCAEIIPTVNSNTWSGSIHVSKTVLKVAQVSNSGTSVLHITGLLDAVNTTKPGTILPFNHGFYSPSRQDTDTYPFSPILDAQAWASVSTAAASTTTITSVVLPASGIFLGMGDMECTVVKIPAFSVTGNVGIVRTWCCIEYQLNSNSPFYDFASKSPSPDPLALAMLKSLYAELPVAVPYYENEEFWKRVLAFIRRVSGNLSVVPGPLGNVATGVNMIANAF